jgi:hypothetical protein
MSIKIMEWVFEKSKAQGLERLILLVIADHCNSEGEDAFPRISVIARRANVSERTVTRKIQDLVSMGELSVIKRQGTSSLYRIVTSTNSVDEKPSTENQSTKKPSKQQSERKRNPIWDALLTACNVNPDNVNSSEASRYGRMVRVLKESNATPDDIFARAQAYRQKFPQATLTPTALVNRWSECDPSRLDMNGLKGVVPQGWNAIKAAREQREITSPKVMGELNVG